MKSKEQIVTDIFRQFRNNSVEFAVLRNFHLIPRQCSIENDIDVLIRSKTMALASDIFGDYGFEREEDRGIYLYNSKPHQHFYLYEKDIHFDVTNGLYYRSLNNVNQWVPVHEILQNSIFENKVCNENVPYLCMPSNFDQFLHLICHVIFDKRIVRKEYKLKIEYLFNTFNIEEKIQYIRLIFFKFSNELISIVRNKETELLYERYISFKGY